MNTRRLLIAVTAALAAALSATSSPARAFPANAPSTPSSVTLVAGSCYSIGQQVAEQNGGTLAKATEDMEGGQPVCRVVILIKGKDGERPRRAEIVVPLG